MMMKKLLVSLLTTVVAVGVAHAGPSKEDVLRKQQQHAERIAAQSVVSLQDLTTGQFQPVRVDATAAECDSTVPGIVIHDDGEAENGYGFNATAGVGEYAEKFTPLVYPAKVTTTCLAWITNAGVTSFNFDIVVYDDDGANGEPGTVLGQMSFVGTPDPITGVPATPAFESFDLSSLNLEIQDGSVYFSVQWDAATEPAGVFIAADLSTSTTKQEGYSRSSSSGTWAPMGQAGDPTNADYRALFIRPAMPIAGPGAPSVVKEFAPSQIMANEISTLTITLHNESQPTAAVLGADLVDTLPSGVVIAPTPNAATTCVNGTLDAVAGGGAVTLFAGAEIPAEDNCTISVDVTSSTDGGYDNVIPADGLQTQHGNNANPATAHLQVGYVFPEPYCSIDFPSAVEPISRVKFADIDNASDPAIDGSPALEDFTSVLGHVGPGATLPMIVEGNTNGGFTTVVQVYFDWDQSGTFEASEGYLIGEIVNSTGTDGVQAVADITIPLDATPGETRMRVTKKFNSAADPCNTSGFGQAEDYTIDVAAPDPSPRVSKAFAPEMIMANDVSTLTLTLTNDLNTGVATLTAPFTDNFPANLVVAPTPNASTTCGSGTVTATAGADSVTLAAGATIPGEGTCTISVDVTSAVDDVYTNVIPVGALGTDLGNSPFEATADLQVGYIFPQPYCAVDFPSAVEPISLVNFADISNASDTTVDATPALEDFTGITGHVRAGRTVSMAVEGNTNGPYTTVVKVYIDWDQSGTFEASEGTLIGEIANSDGTDGQQAVNDIAIPLDAVVGTTRMRVTKRFSSAADPCNTTGYGQAEDYTLDVAPPRPEVSKSFAPETVQVGDPSTATITLTNNTAADATLTAALVDVFPTGVTVSNVATDCGLVINAQQQEVGLAGNQVSLPAGVTIPMGESCSITATAQAAAPGTFTNVIAAGDLQTDQGNNVEDASATLTVVESPYLTVAFNPDTVQRTQDSTQVITLVNPAATDATLTAALVNELPAGVVATSASTSCIASASFGGDALASSTITLPAGSVIPANGSCQLQVTVHSDSLGTYVSEFAEGDLQTDQGNNIAPASATLTVVTLPSDPVIGATPGDFTASQASNTVTTQMLTIGNTGGSELTWDVYENGLVGENGSSNGNSTSSSLGVQSGPVAGAVNLRDQWSGTLPAFSVDAVAANCDSSVAGIVIHDDGEAENGFGWNPTAGVGRIADPFTPDSYPATISSVCLALITNANVTSINFDIAVYAADGTGGAPGTELGRKSFVGHPDPISGVPATPSFESFNLSDLGLNITSGSVYISVEWDAAAEPEGVFLAADLSPATPAVNGYMGGESEPWAPIVDSNPEYRAMFIRPVIQTAGTCSSNDLPWLSVSPTSGTTAVGDTSTVAVSFDSTNLASGTYTGSLCISSNDPVTPIVSVPVSLTVNANPPSATVTPQSLDFNLSADATGSQTVDIANATGSDPLTFSIMARTSANADFRLQPTPRERKDAAALFAKHPPSLAASNSNAEPSVQDAPWMPPAPALAGTPLVFMHDDGSAENAIGWGSTAGESMAVFINRFQPPAGTGPYTITNVSILWPDAAMSGGVLTGLTANLVFYYDFTPDGDPSDAFRLGGDQLVTIGAQGELENYPVSVAVPGDGDIYIGFADWWALAGDYSPRMFPAALDQSTSAGMSYISADTTDAVDLDNLANNDTTDLIDNLDASLAGNWVIRAVGSTGTSCVGPAVPWLTAAPTSGTVNAAESSQVTVTADPSAASLTAGTYTATLCISTNDPSQVTIAIPVTLTVTSADGIFCDGFEDGGDGSCADGGTPAPIEQGDVVASGPVNIALPGSYDGIFVNWLTGETCAIGNDCHGQLNIYSERNGSLGFLWTQRPTGTGGVGSSHSAYAVLQAGDVVGPGAMLINSDSASAASWTAGTDGYLGFAFDCSALGTSESGICYGYAHIVAGQEGSNGRLIQYWFDRSGAAITIQ